jgi:hypothetical protein
MAEMKVQKPVPVGKRQGGSPESGSGSVPKNTGRKRSSNLFDGHVDERYRGNKPGLPYTGS